MRMSSPPAPGFPLLWVSRFFLALIGIPSLNFQLVEVSLLKVLHALLGIWIMKPASFGEKHHL